jgi:hypothetical protein
MVYDLAGESHKPSDFSVFGVFGVSGIFRGRSRLHGKKTLEKEQDWSGITST